MLLFSFPCLVARQIIQVIFLLRFILSLTLMLIFDLFFIWRLIWDVLNHLGWSQMDCLWLLFFLATIGSTGPYVLKGFLLWYGKFCVLQRHKCLQVLSWGLQLWQLMFPWCPCCRQGTGLEFLHWLDTIFPLHYYYGLAPGLCTACHVGPQWVGLSLVSA